jgi:4-amino-4-deoxy-L-arabinose transferase-like glycosyltransferase
METVTLTRPAPPPAFVLQPPRPRATEPRRLVWQHVGVVMLLLATLVLRLWGVKQGLPYSYNSDEATHFVPRAIGFFSGGLNPHYFLNPPAYSYLLNIVFEVWFGGAGAASRAYHVDPTAVFVVARVVAAGLGTIAVWLTYLTGSRLLSRTTGLLAAAIFGLAFLPIFYSHLALNDVPTLAPVTLSLYGIAGVLRLGRRRDYLLAGLGIGLAAATKYTGGITLVCLMVAFAADGRRHGLGRRGWWLGSALALALVAFTVANPYWLLDFSAFSSGVSDQASLAAGSEPVKLGTGAGGGIAYYLWTFSWGFGLLPSLAALAGAAALLLRRRWETAALLLIAPVAFILFMGVQQRYFGRWLMPIFPLVALLAALAGTELVRLARTRGVPVLLAGIVVAVGLLAQSVIADVHDDRVLSRPDTRALTRAWMVAHVPAGAKVVIEPVVPAQWTVDVGRSLPWTRDGARWYQYPTWLSRLSAGGRLLPDGRRRYVAVDEYERVLRPSLIAQYERQAYCWVVVSSLQEGRADVSPREAPGAIAYYRELARQGRLLYSVSPFTPGARPVPFGFDWSIDYYPSQYRLPGPVMSVYHLTGGRCATPS